jgi:hypothetical protein
VRLPRCWRHAQLRAAAEAVHCIRASRSAPLTGGGLKGHVGGGVDGESHGFRCLGVLEGSEAKEEVIGWCRQSWRGQGALLKSGMLGMGGLCQT